MWIGPSHGHHGHPPYKIMSHLVSVRWEGHSEAKGWVARKQNGGLSETWIPARPKLSPSRTWSRRGLGNHQRQSQQQKWLSGNFDSGRLILTCLSRSDPVIGQLPAVPDRGSTRCQSYGKEPDKAWTWWFLVMLLVP